MYMFAKFLVTVMFPGGNDEVNNGKIDRVLNNQQLKLPYLSEETLFFYFSIV